MPAPRPRATGFVAGKRVIISMYSPKPYKEWQAEAAKALKLISEARFDGPVEVELLCVAERPKTTKLFGPKPDVDNYAKGVLDVVTKDGRFWGDDSQVQSLTVTKAWTRGAPGIGLKVRAIDPPTFLARLRAAWGAIFKDL